MVIYRPIAAICVWLVICWGIPSYAENRPGSPLTAASAGSEMVDRGINLYLEGRYEDAQDFFERALSREDLDINRRLGAFQYLAFSHIALGNFTTARLTFRKLLQLKPDYRLPAGTAPKIVDVFDKVREQFIAETPPAVVIEHAPPQKGTLGTSTELSANVTNLPSGAKLIAYYRYDKLSDYSRKTMKMGKAGVFSASLPSPMNTDQGVLIYRILARDKGGKILASTAPASDPHQVAFSKAQSGGQKKESGSSTWWIWVLVGGVVAGAAVGLGVGLTRGGNNNGRAIVTIEVQD
jgi:tetratricopeptide (TPR) repeat protein